MNDTELTALIRRVKEKRGTKEHYVDGACPCHDTAPQLAAECERLREELADEKAGFKAWMESHDETVKANVARENALRADLAEARKAIGKNL